MIVTRVSRIAVAACTLALGCARDEQSTIKREDSGAAVVIAQAPGRSSRPLEAEGPQPRDLLQELPERLQPLGDSLGCRVPGNRTQGLDAREWVLALPQGSGHVAWCRRTDTTQSRYDMLVALTAHPWRACPSLIPLNAPETFTDFRLIQLPEEGPYPIPFAEYQYLEANGGGGPVHDAGSPAGLALEYGVGDAGNILLCHGDRWAIAGYH